MEAKDPASAAPTTPRFGLGKQSSLAPESDGVGGGDTDAAAAAADAEANGVMSFQLMYHTDAAAAAADAEANGVMSFQLMYLAHEGNAEGIRELLDSGADPNFRDSDGRTALHIASCEGHPEVVELLLQRSADAAVEDQWGSTVRLFSLTFPSAFSFPLLLALGGWLRLLILDDYLTMSYNFRGLWVSGL
jgi:hypothetical protein